ncbi:VacB/RNase II family 3'-5' exoribonuclease [bacterium]|nr:VacB/RNase II family 3'-5' exoribonuclease [bacterium]
MDDLQGSILALLRRHPGGLLPGRIREELGLRRGDSRQLRRILLRMLEGDALRKHRGRFLLPSLEPKRGRGLGRHGGASLPLESVEQERARGMEHLLGEYGLDAAFPESVLMEADTQAERDPFMRGERRDLSDLRIICIDPADARDHDDALSLEALKDGGHRLGVHIADVAQYVHEGSPLDVEARRRGNSTYFYLDTIPMLPQRLSGDLCSLLENKARPAMTVFMNFDARGEIISTEIVESRVQVSASLSYERADELLEEPGEFADTLRGLLSLSVLLRARRSEEGAIHFILPERVPQEVDGQVESFGPNKFLRSHAIVEECMLAANREVARFLRERKVKTLHRVHERPNEEDVQQLQAFLEKRGITWKRRGPIRSEDYRRLAAKVSEHEDRERLLFKMLRSMKRAAYGPKPLGHFGLSWEDYLHFTSPIRRYPDLLVHRQIKAILRNKRGQEPRDLESLGVELTEVESNSMAAERDGLRLEMTLWARRHMGEIFDMEVQAVLAGGLIIRLPDSGVESFLPASLLGDEWFNYEEEHERLRGERTGKVYASGDRMKVLLVDANLFTRRIHFLLEEHSDRGETVQESPPKEH